MSTDEPIEIAANRLARELRNRPWYHRTTTAWIGGSVSIRVWGEDEDRPEELPGIFLGFPVEWCRVTSKHPCPFGSVK